jgi:DNA-binding MarR family transcriptional regulator
MVALLDALEQAGIVARHPSGQDRRRNVTELTKPGREISFRRSTRRSPSKRTLSAFSETKVQATFAEHRGPLSVHQPLTADSAGSIAR